MHNFALLANEQRLCCICINSVCRLPPSPTTNNNDNNNNSNSNSNINGSLATSLATVMQFICQLLYTFCVLLPLFVSSSLLVLGFIFYAFPFHRPPSTFHLLPAADVILLRSAFISRMSERVHSTFTHCYSLLPTAGHSQLKSSTQKFTLSLDGLANKTLHRQNRAGSNISLSRDSCSSHHHQLLAGLSWWCL